MVTNKLWGGAKPELLRETKGMNAADELVFLNREIRRLQQLCEEQESTMRSVYYRLNSLDWSPAVTVIKSELEEALNIGDY